jgi:hypothetical protein
MDNNIGWNRQRQLFLSLRANAKVMSDTATIMQKGFEGYFFLLPACER